MTCTRIPTLFTTLVVLGTATGLFAPPPAPALTVEAVSPEAMMAAADLACSATVTDTTCFRTAGSDAIFTRATLEVRDRIKGELPPVIELVYRGGVLGQVRMDDSAMPHLSPGDARIFCLEPGEAGAFTPFAGRLGIWPEASGDAPVFANGTLPADGLSLPRRRHIRFDRGEPIGVIADVSTRPAGLTEAQALTALTNALAAWEAETGITFQVEGTETFSQPADTINDYSGRIRVQMHDNWNEIPDGGSTLGFGGSYVSGVGGTGGEFLGRSFRATMDSYVVLNHPSASLSNPATLEEVLCHEIGHTLGLDHSSETFGESNATLSEALMFYLAHKDGRGADPRTWDVDALHRAYPITNTPPFSYDRYLTVVTSPTGTIANPEVNRIHLVTGDIDGDSVTIEIVDDFASDGAWSLSGNTVTYTTSSWFSDGSVSDPLTGYYERFLYRVSDGTFTSGVTSVNVIGIRSDTRPSALPDGLPDSWMLDKFGSINPVAGTSGASDDIDDDRLTTLEEFVLGSDPNLASSGSVIDGVSVVSGATRIHWDALPYSVYDIEESLDSGATWTPLLRRQSLAPTPAPQVDSIVPSSPHALYRLRTRH